MSLTNNKKIALAVFALSIASAIIYFLKKRKTIVGAAVIEFTPSAPQSKTVFYEKGLSKLSESAVKTYATWIDRIVQILALSRIERKSPYGIPTEEALKNADALSKLNNEDLKAVANYWIAVRGNKLITDLDNFVDQTSRLIELRVRLEELGFKK